MAKVHALRRLPTLALRRRRERLLQRLHLPAHLIRASVVERFNTCGKPNCACARGQKHGPFYYLTQCLAAGHIQKFLLKHPTELGARPRATTAFNQYYDGLEELSQLNTELLRRGDASGEHGP